MKMPKPTSPTPPDANHSAAHTALVTATVRALSDLTWRGRRACWVDRRIIGKFVAIQEDGSRYTLNTGRKGQSDIQGSTCSITNVMGLHIPGLHFEMECKTGEGELMPQQLIWQRTCDSLGILHLVVRDVETPVRFILSTLDRLADWA